MKKPDTGVHHRSQHAGFGMPPGFLGKHIYTILAWPVIALLLACLLWSLTLSALERDRSTLREIVFKQADSLVRAYAGQLQRTVEHIDQLTLSLKYDRGDPFVILNLERRHASGQYPDSALLYATIINRDGEPVTSTVSSAKRLSFVDMPYFKEHKNGAIDGLLISGPDFGHRINKMVIRFSRRLQLPDGEFDGMAMVAVDPAYLGAFHDESSLGKNDFVSVRFAHGPLLVTKSGPGIGVVPASYRADPVFGAHAGVT